MAFGQVGFWFGPFNVDFNSMLCGRGPIFTIKVEGEVSVVGEYPLTRMLAAGLLSLKSIAQLWLRL